jgi:hypothetical protein
MAFLALLHGAAAGAVAAAAAAWASPAAVVILAVLLLIAAGVGAFIGSSVRLDPSPSPIAVLGVCDSPGHASARGQLAVRLGSPFGSRSSRTLMTLPG